MRRLSARLLSALELPDSEAGVVPAIGAALERVRGRPVRLHAVPFPPGIASGLWIDRATHDVIAYERHTDLEHQLVIIGHEIWHMFEEHDGAPTAHGPAASRAAEQRVPDAVRALVAAVCADDPAGEPPGTRTDLRLHIALRAERTQNTRTPQSTRATENIQGTPRTRAAENAGHTAAGRHEEEAEYFGYRFATGVREALAQARTAADPAHLAGRIQVSMAHRIRRS
ncbi:MULTISPECIES: hypothetical protein [unclassified Streptomyces]|uniref:hypothetical protein n=1 Tax=unclassified Streptomyces TaxID=2593676 RepID=UPI0007DD9A79|nr:hypothetical protein [Streptomyces sp. SAT1]ANH92464.1 hypothetical protein A8713_15945 [Streptomyces sp. SAT1]